MSTFYNDPNNNDGGTKLVAFMILLLFFVIGCLSGISLLKLCF
jgi:hypothetical protein